ncbi:MAG: hypothetical protein AAF989_07330 [Planctomycetota bacterium]
MKKDLRKKLKAAAKRREKRRATNGPARVVANEIAAPDMGATFGGAAEHGLAAGASAVSVTNQLFQAVLDVAESPSESGEAVNAMSIVSACRAYLRFGTPQGQASGALHDRFLTLERESASHMPKSIAQRAIREAVNDLMKQASGHVGQGSGQDSFVDYLRTIA